MHNRESDALIPKVGDEISEKDVGNPSDEDVTDDDISNEDMNTEEDTNITKYEDMGDNKSNAHDQWTWTW